MSPPPTTPTPPVVKADVAERIAVALERIADELHTANLIAIGTAPVVPGDTQATTLSKVLTDLEVVVSKDGLATLRPTT